MAKKSNNEKYFLNLAGEYRVCFELLKRGIFATITMGNMKGADIHATGPNRKTAVIEVKASKSSRFVTGFYQKYKIRDMEHPTFWVLYTNNPDDSFFILTHEELSEAQAMRNRFNKKLSWEARAARVRKGVDNVLAQDVVAHKNRWDKIEKWCKQ